MYLSTVFLCFCGLILSVYSQGCPPSIVERIDCNERPCTVKDVSPLTLQYCCDLWQCPLCCEAFEDSQPAATTPKTKTTLRTPTTMAVTSTYRKFTVTEIPHNPSFAPETTLASTSESVRKTTSSRPVKSGPCPPRVVRNIDCNERPCTVKDISPLSLQYCCDSWKCRLCCEAFEDSQLAATTEKTKTTLRTPTSTRAYPNSTATETPRSFDPKTTLGSTSRTVRNTTSSSPVDGQICPPRVVKNIDCNERPCTVKDISPLSLQYCCDLWQCSLCCEAFEDLQPAATKIAKKSMSSQNLHNTTPRISTKMAVQSTTVPSTDPKSTVTVAPANPSTKRSSYTDGLTPPTVPTTSTQEGQETIGAMSTIKPTPVTKTAASPSPLRLLLLLLF